VLETKNEGHFGKVTDDDIAMKKADHLTIDPKDYILSNGWDAAPIVMEDHNLIFFTMRGVASTKFKKLFRRMMGLKNWHKKNPHDPSNNGLKYLFDYEISDAQKMMESSKWRKVMYIREPKERVLSAFLKFVKHNDGSYLTKKCCPEEGKCAEYAAESFGNFLRMAGVCRNAHWAPQTWRIEGKYWPYLDEINRIERASISAKELLEDLGVWEEYGATGWGENGTESIFPENYKTQAWQNWMEYYDEDTEPVVEEMYKEDYSNPYFHFDAELDDFIATTAEDVDDHDDDDDDDDDMCGVEDEEDIPDEISDDLEIDEDHYIFQKDSWDGAPVVVEELKLLFFTEPGMASTTFKLLLRRMSGLEEWGKVDDGLPHDPEKNGLKYLSDYSLEEAKDMLTNEDWTRAIFSRDPKERVLATYLEVTDAGEDWMIAGCCEDEDDEDECMDTATGSLEGFLELIQDCCSPEWMPQTDRMEGRYWPYINFVGTMDNIAEDTQKLLETVSEDAWEQFGESGWGNKGRDRIFGTAFTKSLSKSKELMTEYYTAKAEKMVEEMFEDDYDNRVLDLEMTAVMLDPDGDDEDSDQ